MIEKNPVLQKLIDDSTLYWSVQVQSKVVIKPSLTAGERKPKAVCP